MPSIKVLLVEDEGLIRVMIAELLRDEGFEVVEVWDGDAAARLLDTAHDFDVLFTDVRIPGTLDGIDVAMRARHRDPAFLLLITSGYSAQLAVRLSTFEPAAVFIGKPYRLSEIADTLTRLAVRL